MSEFSESYGLIRAISELKSIISCQWHNGMLPQIRFVPIAGGYRPDADDWGVTPRISGPTRYPTSGITQPPILAYCTYLVYRRAKAEEQARHTQEFMQISAAVDRYHDWLLRERDPLGEGLVVCVHPWETGTDNSPAFNPLIDETRNYILRTGLNVKMFGRADTRHVDPSQRPADRDYFAYFGLIALFRKHNYRQASIVASTPFLLQDVLFNTLFAASLSANAQLQEALARHSGLDPGDADALLRQASINRTRASATTHAIRSKMWHSSDGLFYSYDLRGGKVLTTPTVSSLIPLFSAVATTEQAAQLVSWLNNSNSFGTSAPVPSTPANSALFNPTRYWCGPSWPVTNWLIYTGLLDHDPSMAQELLAKTLRMISEGNVLSDAAERACWVLERNSPNDELTTPSPAQYAHAWLWDSAIVAMSWPLIKVRPQPPPALPPHPGFWEYYEPFTGAPLGAKYMTWTASLFLEILDDLRGSQPPES